MKQNGYYLSVIFKKNNFSNVFAFFKPYKISFGIIDKDDYFISTNGDKYLFINKYLEKENNKELYGYPTKISNSYNEFESKILDENFILYIKTKLENLRQNQYFSTILENNKVLISEQDTIGNISIIDLKQPLHIKTNIKNKQIKRKDIIDFLKQRIIAQDEAIDKLVTSILSNQLYADYEGLKENILLIGSTGTGKTEIISNLAKILEIPFIKVDATKYTKTGYKGEDVVSMLKLLYFTAKKNKDLAENGIIFIDEFDKLGYTHDSTISTNDVQMELFEVINGGNYKINKDDENFITIDTSKITFILAGAFQNIIKKLNETKTLIGFNSNANEFKNNNGIFKKITKEELQKIGNLEPELLGRMSKIIQLNSLDKNDLRNIIDKSSISNLKLWQDAFFKKNNVKLVFDDKSKDLIAEQAYDLDLGARGIKIIVTKILEKIKEEILDGNLNDCEVHINEDTIKNPEKYKVKKKIYKKEMLEEDL